jgi:hypothetical protein
MIHMGRNVHLSDKIHQIHAIDSFRFQNTAIESYTTPYYGP